MSRTETSAPYRIVSSNVLLSREDSELIANTGVDAIAAVRDRLQVEFDRPVKIEVNEVFDADAHSL